MLLGDPVCVVLIWSMHRCPLIFLEQRNHMCVCCCELQSYVYLMMHVETQSSERCVSQFFLFILVVANWITITSANTAKPSWTITTHRPQNHHSNQFLCICCAGVFITKGDVGVGTIVGSAVFNILCIIGVCGIFAVQVKYMNVYDF